MLANWSLFIIIIALLLMIIISFRHFPALAILNVEDIPEEKKQRIKEKIIKERMKRKLSGLTRFFDKIALFFNKISSSLWEKLKQTKSFKKEKKEKKSLLGASDEHKIKMFYSLSLDLIKEEKWAEAEKKLIQIISLDDKNFLAFLSLGEVYYQSEKLQEAKQTWLYAKKLSQLELQDVDPNDLSNLNYSLALINKDLGDYSSAIDNVKENLKNNPNNPRYLDLILDLYIIKKDKFSAQKFLEKIKKANPENNNIENWEKEISLLD